MYPQNFVNNGIRSKTSLKKLKHFINTYSLSLDKKPKIRIQKASEQRHNCQRWYPTPHKN